MATDLVKAFFTAREASSLSKMSSSMLDYLCRSKIVTPSRGGRRGRGAVRKYSFGDVVVLRALSKLLGAGISVKRLKAALGNLQRLHAEITPADLPATHLVTDGNGVYFRKSAQVLEDLSSGQLAFAFVLELEPIRREILDKLVVHVAGRDAQRYAFQLKQAAA